MKLYYSPTSPYVRKVTMFALETGLDDQIERIVVKMAGPTTEVAKANPLGKVPALVRDDGSVLYDSPVICEYLDSLHDRTPLFPKTGEARWNVLRMQALGDGLMDAGILRLMEGRRPENEQSPSWVERQTLAGSQAFDAMEASVELLGEQLSVAHITYCVALGWFDFRLPNEGWRDGHPALADWYAGFSARPSAMASEPQDAA